MQRCCSKLRSLGLLRLSSPIAKPQQLLSSPHHHLRRGHFHSSAPNFGNKSLITHSMISPNFGSHSMISPNFGSHSMISPNFGSLLFTAPSTLQATASSSRSSPLVLSVMQVRHLTLKQRKRKLKSRQPPTPVVSKLKKIKMKPYSSFKGRFRITKDGQIRRWKEGKRHNAHLKSKIAK